jgi:hypothetical protein
MYVGGEIYMGRRWFISDVWLLTVLLSLNVEEAQVCDTTGQ